MSRPVLFVIDDDAGVVHALRDDLGRRFGKDFRVIAESSAATGLAILRELAAEREPVALLIVDHDLNEMSGVGFLARAHELHPLAKRVLLVERDYSARPRSASRTSTWRPDRQTSSRWYPRDDQAVTGGVGVTMGK
jgi:thioredoxin reductase (NADPH)